MENLKISTSTRKLEGPYPVLPPPPRRPTRPDTPPNSYPKSTTRDPKHPRHKELSKPEARDQKPGHQSTRHLSHSHSHTTKPINPPTKGTVQTSQSSDETHEETKNAELPPPEVSPASILAVLSLGNHITNLKHLIGMYEDFEKICHDTPAYQHFARHFVASFHHVLRALSRTSSEARYLLDEGQGTVEPAAVEVVAAKVLVIAREARKELRRRLGEVQVGEEERERLERGMRGWVMEFYVGKMGAVVRELEGERMVREVKGMKEALMEAWEAGKGMSGREVEEMGVHGEA